MIYAWITLHLAIQLALMAIAFFVGNLPTYLVLESLSYSSLSSAITVITIIAWLACATGGIFGTVQLFLGSVSYWSDRLYPLIGVIGWIYLFGMGTYTPFMGQFITGIIGGSLALIAIDVYLRFFRTQPA